MHDLDKALLPARPCTDLLTIRPLNHPSSKSRSKFFTVPGHTILLFWLCVVHTVWRPLPAPVHLPGTLRGGADLPLFTTTLLPQARPVHGVAYTGHNNTPSTRPCTNSWCVHTQCAWVPTLTVSDTKKQPVNNRQTCTGCHSACASMPDNATNKSLTRPARLGQHTPGVVVKGQCVKMHGPAGHG